MIDRKAINLLLWIVLLLAALGSTACSTLRVSDGTKKDLCSDAAWGVGLAQVALSVAVERDQREYYLKWLAAAEMAVELTCSEAKP